MDEHHVKEIHVDGAPVLMIVFNPAEGYRAFGCGQDGSVVWNIGPKDSFIQITHMVKRLLEMQEESRQCAEDEEISAALECEECAAGRGAAGEGHAH